MTSGSVLSPAILESHVGILGKTGSGKSNLAKTIVEGLLDDGARVCVIDPTGTWYGLRLTRDRTPSPYEVVMFGGVHADIAIGRTHGAAVAETIGTTSTPAVIDTRTMTVGERTEFFTGFAETLLQRNRGPLHLVIDEAHLFAPQGRVADPRSGAMLHAANNLVSLGRGVGLRIILISQRPAKLHKDSLTQIETLVAMRLIAPQDRRAIEDWIGEWADPKQGAELVASLPSLRTGEAWIWSPEAGVLRRWQVPLAATLDTGRPSADPIELGQIDIAAVQEKLGEVAAEVVANDPATLRKRIRQLESESAARLAIIDRRAEPEVRIERVEVPVLDGHYVAALSDAAYQLTGAAGAIEHAAAEILDKLGLLPAPRPAPATGPANDAARAGEDQGRIEAPPDPVVAQPVERRGAGLATAEAPGSNPGHGANGGASSSSALGLAILAALSDAPDGRSIRQLGLMTGYSSAGGFFRRTLGALREAGLVEGTDPVRITAAGARVAPSDPIPLGRPLLEAWMQNPRLGTAAAGFLPVLAEAWPDPVSAAAIAELTGYSPAGGYFRRSLKKLRDLGLVSGTSDVRIAGELVRS